jgi:hypothetical protein
MIGYFLLSLCRSRRKWRDLCSAAQGQGLPWSIRSGSFASTRAATHGSKGPKGKNGRRREVPIPAASMCSKVRVQNYSITLSVRASSEAGSVRPSAVAVLRLITSSNSVGCCTGRLAGFAQTHGRRTFEVVALLNTPTLR